MKSFPSSLTHHCAGATTDYSFHLYERRRSTCRERMAAVVVRKCAQLLCGCKMTLGWTPGLPQPPERSRLARTACLRDAFREYFQQLKPDGMMPLNDGSSGSTRRRWVVSVGDRALSPLGVANSESLYRGL